MALSAFPALFLAVLLAGFEVGKFSFFFCFFLTKKFLSKKVYATFKEEADALKSFCCYCKLRVDLRARGAGAFIGLLL